MSKLIVEETTGYVSILMCDHPKIICFYRSGKEVAIFHKGDKYPKDILSGRLEIREGEEEHADFIESFLHYMGSLVSAHRMANQMKENQQ